MATKKITSKQRQAALDALWQESLIPKAPEHLSGKDLQLFNAAAKKVKVMQHPDLGGWYANISELKPQEHLALYGRLPLVSVTQEMLDTGHLPEPTPLAKGLAATRLKVVKDLWDLGNWSASFEMKAIKNALDDYLAVKQEDALAALKGRAMYIGRAQGADSLLSKLVAKAVKQFEAKMVEPSLKNVINALEKMREVEEIEKTGRDPKKWKIWLKGVDKPRTGSRVANAITKEKKKNK